MKTGKSRETDRLAKNSFERMAERKRRGDKEH